MEITAEIESIFSEQADSISRVELTYRNGGKVIGTIRKIRQSPLRLVIQKTELEKGERPKHRVVFDHVVQMQLGFEDGTDKVFE